MKLQMCSVVIVLSVICTPAKIFAGSWYVSINGLSTNAGSFTSPWSLAHALSRPITVVFPGDTILLRGGTYKGPLTSSLSGSAVAPILVKNYPNETVILLGDASAGIADQVILTINGQFTNYMGLEFTTNAITRISTGTTDPPTDIYSANGVFIYGQSVKLINCIIHNCPRGGIGYWSNSANAEVYGCLIFNNGYTNVNRGHGPGLYVQNIDETKPKSLLNSFIFNGFSIGVQFYSSSNDYLKGFIIDSCTIFNAGANAASNQSRRANLLAGGASENITARIRNLNVTNNVFYRDTTDNSIASFMPSSPNRKNVELGSEHTGLRDKFVNFSNNLLYGDPTPLIIHKWDSGVFRNNVINSYKSNYPQNRQLIEQISAAPPFSNWDNNSYFTNQPTYTTPFGFKTFTDWKLLYKVDSNATFTNTGATANYYFVRKNRYEPHKYYVTVQNNTVQNSIEMPLDIPAFVNVSYAVFDVQYSLKTPVDTGTFNGVSIPLNLSLTAVAPLTGISPVAPKHTSKTLGTFIIEFYPENTSIKNGNWADPTVWADGQVPQYFNKVKISHNVSVTASAWCKSVIIKTGNLNILPGILMNIGQQ